MKLNIHHLLFLLPLSLLLAACGGSDDDTPNTDPSTVNNSNRNFPTANAKEIYRLEFPKVKGGNSVILTKYSDRKVNYSVEWDKDLKAARWSVYEMTESNSKSNVKRYSVAYGTSDYWSKQYPTDPDMPQPYGWQAGKSTDPYWGSGYSHGHLCPSADRLNTSNANYQTFYLTNMSPMNKTFNEHIWTNIEDFVRTSFRTMLSNDTKKYNDHNDTLYVVKGGTIDSESYILKRTAKGMIVPMYFFCAMLMKNHEGYKAIGFWIKHDADSPTKLSASVVNIATLQQLTGLDFFCNLPDNTENEVENLPKEKVMKAWGIN